MDPVSINPDGLIKVALLLHWSSKDLHEYCVKHGLPNNFDYVDPTKGEDNRECGLHRPLNPRPDHERPHRLSAA